MPGARKLGRPTDHRKAMMRAMVTYLLESGRIVTASLPGSKSKNRLDIPRGPVALAYAESKPGSGENYNIDR